MLKAILTKYLAPYRGTLMALVALQFLASIAGLYLPRLNADLINNGVAVGNRSYIWHQAWLMCAITAAQLFVAVAAVYFGARAAAGFGRDLRGAVFHQVMSYSAREVNEFGAPSLITRVTNDVQQIQMLVLLGCTLAVGAPITLVGGIIMALREDVGLSALLVVSVPALVGIVALVVRRMIPTFRTMQERIDGVNRVLREQIVGIRVVRAFVREDREMARFSESNTQLTETSSTAGRLMALMFPSVMIVLNTSMVAAIWIGSDRLDTGALKVGSLIAFLSYLAQILMSVMMATFMAIMTPRAAVCAERVNEVLLTPSSVVPGAEGSLSTSTSLSLEFRDVSFRYPGAEAPVLDQISFRVAPGTTTAVIGSTGAGKSTLIGMVSRLFDVTSGAVLIDDLDVRSIRPEALWGRIGLVPQKPFLFSGTVESNLRFSNPDATEEELWEALTIAQAADFVRAMPEGLQSVIQQGGFNVSGGQRQRLCIARALVAHPSLYLFDDSFSALDLATDAKLREAMRPVTRDAAVVIVAQRVSTIAQADQILVLEDGQCVGLGTHEDLLRTCETYLEIVESQRTEEAA
ncbi:MAG TPA: multidrug ABC transporter ATP-binding protein [Acidimicrobiaceae bacterium]|jgi:ATP-binding cassette subfamily B multidrug efflux pump|nr:multidrug ABC transporter ATP-binding protein [Acidimicrobiaceae bacterium]